MLTTEEGYDINDIIQPGIDNPDHPIGLVSYSRDCYFTFEDILISAAQLYHKRNVFLTKYERENMQMLMSLINSMDNILEKSIYEIKISTHRNLENFPFSGKISRNQRREITNKFYEFLKKIETEIFEDIEEKGKFSFFEYKKNFNEIKNYSNNFYQSCGFFKDWPDGRLVYNSYDNKINIFTNQEDHLKINLNTNKENGFNVTNLIDYFEFVQKLNKEFNFTYDDNLGYLNTIISNLGSGTNFNVVLKIPSENKQKFLESLVNNKELNIYEIIEKEKQIENFSLFEVSNKSSFLNFSTFLLELVNMRDLF